MPAVVIRIALLMLLTTSAALAFEVVYANKAVRMMGEIASISGNAKGWELEVVFYRPGPGKTVFRANVGPVINVLGGYRQGDPVPVQYCEDCYPAAKIGDIPNVYPITLMFVMLDLLAVVGLAVIWWKQRNAGVRD